MILVYDLLTGQIVASLDGHRGCVRDVSWHPYHQEIISSSVIIIFHRKIYKLKIKLFFFKFEYQLIVFRCFFSGMELLAVGVIQQISIRKNTTAQMIQINNKIIDYIDSTVTMTFTIMFTRTKKKYKK